MYATPGTLVGFLTRTTQALIVQDVVGALVEPIFIRILHACGKTDLLTARRRLALAFFRFVVSFFIVWALSYFFQLHAAPPLA
jgi:hypothetical protein